MAKKPGKKYAAALKQVETREYPLDQAVPLLQKIKFAKFDETVEVHMRLGVDPKHADQMVRGTVLMPNGLGKSKKVLVITSGDKLREAQEAGADYVAFGAFYPTQTKVPKAAADPDILRWWSELMVIPCVAIGGITVENARPLVDAGADFLAVSGGIWGHPDGAAAAVRAFNALFA